MKNLISLKKSKCVIIIIKLYYKIFTKIMLAFLDVKTNILR